MSSIFCKRSGEYKTHPIAVYLSYNNTNYAFIFCPP